MASCAIWPNVDREIADLFQPPVRTELAAHLRLPGCALLANEIALFNLIFKIHAMTGLFRQPVFGRLGGYEDVNDAAVAP
jgi:hypothetical protein